MFTTNNYLTNTLAIICIAGTFLCSTAQATGWHTWLNTSGDGKWETAANWDNGVPNVGNEAAIINKMATAGPCTATNGTFTIDYLRVGHLDYGVLIIDGANITTDNSTRTGMGYDSGNTGVLHMVSGSLTFGAQLVIGGNKSSGMVYQTGGRISAGYDDVTTLAFGSTGGLGIYNFTAGILESRRRAYLAGSGSTFHVDGYDASSSIKFGGTADDGDGAWKQYTGVTLSLSLDGGTTQGTTLINIGLGSDGAANDNDGVATFDSDSLLDLDFKSGARSGTWTVLTAEGGIVDNGLELASGVNDDELIQWSFAVVDGGGDTNHLQVTAVVIPLGTVLCIE